MIDLRYESPIPVVPTFDELLLPLPPGGFAQTIYIAILPGGLKPTVGFALTQAGPFLGGGLTWAANGEYGQFLNFVFMASTLGTIQEVKPDKTPSGFWVSKETAGTLPCAVNQQGCVQNQPDTYTFHVIVQTPSGIHRIDPKMVVTPLTGGD
jgi:hypothetical protein